MYLFAVLTDTPILSDMVLYDQSLSTDAGVWALRQMKAARAFRFMLVEAMLLSSVLSIHRMPCIFAIKMKFSISICKLLTENHYLMGKPQTNSITYVSTSCICTCGQRYSNLQYLQTKSDKNITKSEIHLKKQ